MPKAIPNRVTLQLRLDEDLHAKSKVISENEKRTLNSQFEYFIKKGVEAYEKENGVITIETEAGL